VKRNATPTIKVWPGPNGTTLVHPVSGPLRDSPKGTPWAHDTFTRRRIAEGSILTTPPEGEAVATERETGHAD
jgi:hypothetical protein